MKRIIFILTAISIALTLALTAWGCKNPDNTTNPTTPEPEPYGTGEPPNPPIPTPFAERPGLVLDIGIEGDGDIVFADEAGLQLYTPYGEFKRTMTGGLWLGLATANYGVLDTGRGIMGIGEAAGCNPQPAYDDVYVTGGVPYVSYFQPWWEGDPDPYNPQVCVNFASTSSFSSCDCIPAGISYHPVTAFAYQKVFAPDCIADGDCPWPYTDAIEYGGYAILAYHPLAPLPPLDNVWQGSVDFLVYYDYPTYYNMQNAAFMLGVTPACQLHNLFLVWDLTSMNYMSSRSGMNAQNICDIEFDGLNRLVMSLPNADSVVITDPVIFGDPIVMQQTLGGRQNGLGTLPGEFQGPTGVAIDPRNQNIYVSDTGNGRVQVFDNDGNFIREFGGADPTFTPRAIRVDAFGTVYVANVTDNLQDTLRIFDEYGARIQYGTIEGFVFDKDTHMPIDSALVAVQSTFNPLRDFSASDGSFSFPAVAAGTHDIVAEKYGYNSGHVIVSVTGGNKVTTDVYLERTGIGPAGYGMVTGTVFSSLYNEPVPGLTAEIVGLGVSNQTNGNGEFTLHDVLEGEHIIRLTANGVVYMERYITVTKGEILDLGRIDLPIP
jgi:DNA-binding beta-propeller fold protein YncE